MPKKKRIAFLLGAGASQACGMPGTEKLTEDVLLRIKASADTSGTSSQNGADGDITRLISIIEKEIVNHNQLCTESIDNYETLYDFVNELSKVWHKDHASTLAVSLSQRLSKEYPYKFDYFVDNYDLGQHYAAT
ncbi:MAG: hypothetical protein IIB00_10680, partial [candidate division Zixibacteria bacterium]|nr:hypothetical protein [candidate division Zixibacteria bacterium]